jgi:hypothetical protein
VLKRGQVRRPAFSTLDFEAFGEKAKNRVFFSFFISEKLQNPTSFKVYNVSCGYIFHTDSPLAPSVLAHLF